MFLLLYSWFSHKLFCLWLLRSWLSNKTYHHVLAATLLVFQHNFRLRSCCYALEFPTQLPTRFLLLRSWFSNITSDYVSAATLLVFHHAPVLLITYPYVVATLLHFQLNFNLCLLQLRSSQSNMTKVMLESQTRSNWNVVGSYVGYPRACSRWVPGSKIWKPRA